MRPWIAGQKRFSFRFSQMEQLTIDTPQSLSHAECTTLEQVWQRPNLISRAILSAASVKSAIFVGFSGS